MTNAQIRVDQINVVIEALTGFGSQVRFEELFVVPGFEGRAGFHCRENAYDAGMVSAFGDDLSSLLTSCLRTKMIGVSFSLATEAMCSRILSVIGLEKQGKSKTRILNIFLLKKDGAK
jgi:hypothetical protein